MSTTSSLAEFPTPKSVFQMYRQAMKNRDDLQRQKREAAERRRQAELAVLDELAGFVMESLADSPYLVERATDDCVHVKGASKAGTLEVRLLARNSHGDIEPMIRWNTTFASPNQFAEKFASYLLREDAPLS